MSGDLVALMGESALTSMTAVIFQQTVTVFVLAGVATGTLLIRVIASFQHV